MSGSSFSWGHDPTQFFFSLTPDRVLTAIESAGYICTGRCAPYNSMENRVYEVEIEVDNPRTLSDRFRVAKFYRPGRWTREQILDEHAFLLELQASEIPVIAPLAFEDGTTLREVPGTGIWFTLFPKVGGRAPDELSPEQLLQVGRLLARIHSVGGARPASHRIHLLPHVYGRSSLKFLRDAGKIPAQHEDRIADAVTRLCDLSEPWFAQAGAQRIHGDCHFGNLLWSQAGPFFLDFDDMVMGPPVQDLWLVVPGRDSEARVNFEILLEGYESMRTFDRRTLRLVEPLRGLRFIHFAAWIAKRWEDPAFPRHFPHFGTDKYWSDLADDLREVVALCEAGAGQGSHAF